MLQKRFYSALFGLASTRPNFENASKIASSLLEVNEQPPTSNTSDNCTNTVPVPDTQRSFKAVPNIESKVNETDDAPTSDLLDLLETGSSSPHKRISDFRRWAKTTGLSRESTVYKGTIYEYVAIMALGEHLRMRLVRYGGANDKGIDLLGYWLLNRNLPVFKRQRQNPHGRLKVLVQCKALNKKGGPSQVRELSGAFDGLPASFKRPGEPVLALLASMHPATKGTLDSLARSPLPMGCVMVDSRGIVRQMVWNAAAQDTCLEGVYVNIRHTENGKEVRVQFRETP